MGGEDESGKSTPLSVDAAFAALGNETRMAILQTLAEDDPLAFSELRERVGMRDSGQFSYHLDKLDGHFVTKTDDGYELRQSGRYVVEAVLSGAITENPEIEPTMVDFTCLFCGTSVEVSYRQGTVRLSCKGCGTGVDAASADTEEIEDRELAAFAFPPAGVQGRTVAELQAAAATWVHLDAVALSSDVCPRCSAAVDLSIEACADHARSDGVCDRCKEFRAVRLHYRCRNCIYTAHLAAVMGLLATPELLAFVGEHGLNTTTMGFHWGWEYGEEVHSIEPFEGRFTFEIDGDTLALTVDEHLDVIDIMKTTTSGIG